MEKYYVLEEKKCFAEMVVGYERRSHFSWTDGHEPSFASRAHPPSQRIIFHSKTKYFFDVISLAKKLPIKSAMIETP